MKNNEFHILVLTSTFPSKDTDPVPAFVKDQVINLKSVYPNLKFTVLAPHVRDLATKNNYSHKLYDEYRFHYFIFRKFENFTKNGIMSTLSTNPLYYLLLPFFLISSFRALNRLSIKLKPNVIYAHWFIPNAFIAALVAKKRKIPMVFTNHSSDIQIISKLPFKAAITRFIFDNTYRWTAVSENTVRKSKSAISENWHKYKRKLKVIPMGVNVHEYINNKANLKRLASTGTETTILFLGRLTEIKGVDLLLSALSELKNYNIKVIIAGDGPDLNHLIKIAKSLNLDSRVLFTGYVSGKEKIKLLQKSDILVVPSIMDKRGHTEGLPVVILEGLASNNIVVASSTSGASALIEDKRNGFIFDSGDYRHLTNKLVNAIGLTNKEKEKIVSFNKKIVHNYDWLHVSKEHYVHLFEPIILEETTSI